METGGYVVSGDDYVVVGMMLMLGVLGAVLYRGRSALLYSLKNFFVSKRTYVDEEKEGVAVTAIGVFLLTCVSVLSLSVILLHEVMEDGRVQDATGVPYWLYGVGSLAGMVFIYVKAYLYHLVNWTFFDPEANKTWMKGYLLMTSLTAFLFYPLALLDVFSNLHHELFTTCVILVVIVYQLLLFYKLIINFKTKKYGYVFIFLYFCSVELLPTLVFGHLAIWLSNNFIETNLIY